MYVGVADVLITLKEYMSVLADVPPIGAPPAHFTVVALPST